MDVRKPARDFYRYPQDALNRQVLTGFLRARDAVLEGPAREVTSDHKGRFAIFPVIEHDRDIPVVTQLPQHTGFPRAHSQPGRHDRIIREDIDSN